MPEQDTMFDIGFWEVLLISVMGLIILGPERLPVVMRTGSQWISKVKQAVNSVQAQLGSELEAMELQETLNSLEQKRLKKDRLPGKKKPFDSIGDIDDITEELVAQEHHEALKVIEDQKSHKK